MEQHALARHEPSLGWMQENCKEVNLSAKGLSTIDAELLRFAGNLLLYFNFSICFESPVVRKRLRDVILGTLSLNVCDFQFLPQIAGSYRGSYFSKVGLLITEIAAAPSLPSSFVSLHLSPCVLLTEIAAAPSLPSSFVSLHADYRNRCRS